MTAGIGFAQTGSGSGCLDGNLGQCLTDVVTLPGKAVGAVTSGAESAVGGATSYAGLAATPDTSSAAGHGWLALVAATGGVS